MAKINRFLQKIFALNDTQNVGNIGSVQDSVVGFTASQDPDEIQKSSNYLGGWPACVIGSNSPTLEDRNSLDYLITRQLKYLTQAGIPELLSTERYYTGSVVRSGSKVYISVANDHIGQPITNINYWRQISLSVDGDDGNVLRLRNSIPTWEIELNNFNYGAKVPEKTIASFNLDEVPNGCAVVGDYIYIPVSDTTTNNNNNNSKIIAINKNTGIIDDSREINGLRTIMNGLIGEDIVGAFSINGLFYDGERLFFTFNEYVVALKFASDNSASVDSLIDVTQTDNFSNNDSSLIPLSSFDGDFGDYSKNIISIAGISTNADKRILLTFRDDTTIKTYQLSYSETNDTVTIHTAGNTHSNSLTFTKHDEAVEVITQLDDEPIIATFGAGKFLFLIKNGVSYPFYSTDGFDLNTQQTYDILGSTTSGDGSATTGRRYAFTTERYDVIRGCHFDAATKLAYIVEGVDRETTDSEHNYKINAYFLGDL